MTDDFDSEELQADLRAVFQEFVEDGPVVGVGLTYVTDDGGMGQIMIDQSPVAALGIAWGCEQIAEDIEDGLQRHGNGGHDVDLDFDERGVR